MSRAWYTRTVKIGAHVMGDFSRFRACILLAFLQLGACSSINLESAKSLSTAGENFSVQARSAVFVSENEYQRARDAEAIMHGYSGTTKDDNYKTLLRTTKIINDELSKRAATLDKLSEVYGHFGNLASINASGDTETALDNLGSSINEYAVATRKSPPIQPSVAGVISKVGGITAEEFQKRKIEKASKEIRLKLIIFKDLLSDPLVKSQMLSMKNYVDTSYSAAARILWNEGVYDPSLLLSDFGAGLGMSAQKESLKIVSSNPNVQNALRELLYQRQERRSDLISESYDSTVVILGRLIGEHEKLEKGEELSLVRIRELTSRLKEIISIASKVNAS
jgi:hypothetical protein